MGLAQTAVYCSVNTGSKSYIFFKAERTCSELAECDDADDVANIWDLINEESKDRPRWADMYEDEEI